MAWEKACDMRNNYRYCKILHSSRCHTDNFPGWCSLHGHTHLNMLLQMVQLMICREIGEKIKGLH